MGQNSTVKNFSFITLGRVAAIGLQAVFYLIFAALLEPESYGILNYIVAIAGTFALVSRFGLNYTIIVYQAKKNLTLSDQVNTLVAITSSIAGLILIPINVFAALLSVASSFFIMNQSNLAGLQQYKAQMLNALLKNATLLIIPFLLYFILEIPGIVLGMAICNFIGSIHFFRNLKIKPFLNLLNNYKVLIHNFGVDASYNLPRMVDKLVIVPLLGFFVVGIYQFNMQILFALEILPVALHFFLLSEESKGERHKKLSYLVILGSIALAITAMLLSPFFVMTFFPNYSEGIPSLQILVFTIIPLSMSSIFSAKLQASESTKIGYSALVRIGILLTLIALLGEAFGLVGLSIAVLISVIINTIFLAILYLKTKN